MYFIDDDYDIDTLKKAVSRLNDGKKMSFDDRRELASKIQRVIEYIVKVEPVE